MRGAASGYLRDEDWAGIQAMFTHAQLVTIPNAGHWVHAEQPKLFVEALLAFLTRAER